MATRRDEEGDSNYEGESQYGHTSFAGTKERAPSPATFEDAPRQSYIGSHNPLRPVGPTAVLISSFVQSPSSLPSDRMGSGYFADQGLGSPAASNFSLHRPVSGAPTPLGEALGFIPPLDEALCFIPPDANIVADINSSKESPSAGPERADS